MQIRPLHALAIGALLATVACDKIETTELRSPNGRLVAKLLDDRGAGAATSAYQKVIIQPLQQNSDDVVTVFEGENTDGKGFRDLNLSWASDSTLMIGFCSGTIDSLAQQAVFPDRLVKVQLVRERHGDWPASIPPERRGPEPPCV